MFLPQKYYLRTDEIRAIMERGHVSQHRMAEQLQVSRSYWSQLLNGARPLTADMRHRILECPLFRGIREGKLWRSEAADAAHPSEDLRSSP